MVSISRGVAASSADPAFTGDDQAGGALRRAGRANRCGATGPKRSPLGGQDYKAGQIHSDTRGSASLEPPAALPRGWRRQLRITLVDLDTTVAAR